MKPAERGAMSAFPSYDEMSEEDKKSKGINQLIAKYFAPTGILALLILKSIRRFSTSGSTLERVYRIVHSSRLQPADGPFDGPCLRLRGRVARNPICILYYMND